mgnify:CR=1 FL=1
MSAVDPVLAEQRNFQFLHRIPPAGLIFLDELTNVRLSIPSPDSTFHTRKSAPEERDFQFLHRIPLGPSQAARTTTSSLSFNSFTGFHYIYLDFRLSEVEPTFQFLHRIPLGQSSIRRHGTSWSFNSFTGFHRRHSERGRDGT